MEPGEARQLLEATRDDLVRDLVAILNDAEVTSRLLKPAEIERLRVNALRHLRAAAAIATRYEQERHADEQTQVTPSPPLEHSWAGESTSPGRPHSKRPRPVRG